MAELAYTFVKLLPRNTLSRALGAACRIPAPQPIRSRRRQPITFGTWKRSQAHR